MKANRQSAAVEAAVGWATMALRIWAGDLKATGLACGKSKKKPAENEDEIFCIIQ